jgi:hypothetical protein
MYKLCISCWLRWIGVTRVLNHPRDSVCVLKARVMARPTGLGIIAQRSLSDHVDCRACCGESAAAKRPGGYVVSMCVW